MSRLTDLIVQAKAKDLALGRELEKEFKTLANRRQFGLSFERHAPENVELPECPIRMGNKVRVLPPRGGELRAINAFGKWSRKALKMASASHVWSCWVGRQNQRCKP